MKLCIFLLQEVISLRFQSFMKREKILLTYIDCRYIIDVYR